MNFGFNFGFQGKINERINTCFDPVIVEGDWAGSNEPATNIVPAYTADGTLIYSYRMNTVTGDFVIKFGDTGNEKLDNVMLIIYKHDKYKVGMQWDESLNYYLGNDIDAAQYIGLEKDNIHCFESLVIPELLQHFTFETIGVTTWVGSIKGIQHGHYAIKN